MNELQKPWPEAAQGFSICGGLVALALGSSRAGVTRNQPWWTAASFFPRQEITR